MISSISLIKKQEQRFRNLALLTVVIVYLLILAGGIVRGTGSGMGCPDWPKCFGRWVPPTEISQLPPNYQKIYGAKLKGEVEFNPVKTWIEYANRLLGVLSGFFVFATLLASLSYRRRDIAIFWGTLSAFLLIGVNGWLGSRVVATELAQYMITIHLMVAIAVVFSLLFVFVRASGSSLYKETTQIKTTTLRWLLVVIMVLTVGQILLGTQVRDALDQIIRRLNYAQRDNWIGQLNWSFYVHRSFSLIVLGFHLILIYQLRGLTGGGWLSGLLKALIALVIVEIGTGVIMAYLGVPAIAQPIHLLLAVGLIGLQFVIWLMLNPTLLTPKLTNQDLRFIDA